MISLLVLALSIAVPIWVGFLLFDAIVELVRWTRLRNQYQPVRE